MGIRLSPRAFGETMAEGDVVTAGAAALDKRVAETAATAGIGGMEFLFGIPGTVGGALRMNAGANGGETRDILMEATGIGHFFAGTRCADQTSPKPAPDMLLELMGDLAMGREATLYLLERAAGARGRDGEWHVMQNYFKLHSYCRFNHGTLDAIDGE